MKRPVFSGQQIAYSLCLPESETPVIYFCHRIGVSEATYYTWKKKFGDMGLTMLKRLKIWGRTSGWFENQIRNRPTDRINSI